MGLIHLPYSSQQKPPLGSQINWSHPLSKGLVGCWLFNEGGGLKVKDLTGLHDGTRTTGATFYWSQSPQGSILSQQGGDAGQYVLCGTRNDLLLYNKPCSIVALVQANSAGDNNQGCIISKQTSSGATVSLNVGVTSTFYFWVKGTTSLNVRASNNALPFGTTQPLRQIAATWDGSVTATNVHLYVQGKETTYQTQTDGATLTDNSNRQIGLFNYSSGVGAGLRGKIGYVYVYNRALSPQEIKSLYIEPYCFIERPKTWTTTAIEQLIKFFIGVSP
jgi:hypothetical protein